MRFSGLAWSLLFASSVGLALAIGPTGSASAQGRAQEQDVDPEARQRFQLATTLYGQGRFVEAAQEFERVYELTDNAVVLHNIYVTYRDAGDERRAADALRRYLEEAEDIPDRAVMEGRLRTLERQIAQQDQQREQLEEHGVEVEEPDPTPAPGVAGGAPGPAAGPPPESPSRVGPFVLMGAGGALLIGGGVVGLLAMQQYDDLEEDCGLGLACPSDEQDAVDELGTLTLVADILLGAGLLTAAAGLVWLVLMPDEPEATTAGLGLACDGRGCMASYRGELP